MIKIDLITGFLGSGKTTFIRKYAAYLTGRGERIAILENDLGAVNVDMMLLQELMGDNCELEMISGGCDAGTHRRRFKTKLISMGMCGYDRVLIEPSGIFDMDEFFDALCEEPLDRWYEIGNVIAIVDARLEEELPAEADQVLASEAASAGCVVFSKAQEASEAEMERTAAHLNRALEAIGCGRRFSRQEILRRDWDDLTETDMERILGAGYRMEAYQKAAPDAGKDFSSLCFLETGMTKERIGEAARRVMEDPSCGTVLRIKGFLKEGEGWLEFNATRRESTMKPIGTGQEVLIVIGQDLSRERIGKILGSGED
ncbi:MAG: GTP-binding protein [Eubacteriales bacterium]|nr:GTP-binding protein [Eubacteriales bacterium]